MRPVSGPSWWAKSAGQIIRNATYTGRRQDASERHPPLRIARGRREVPQVGEVLDGWLKHGSANADVGAMLSEVLTCLACEDSPI